MRCPVCGTVHRGSGPCCCVQCELKLKHHFRVPAGPPRIEVPAVLREEVSLWVPRSQR